MDTTNDTAAAIDAIDYSSLEIRPEYIDANGHLNVGYYGVIFDKASDLPWKILGTYGRKESEGLSVFVLQSQLTFQREMMVGDPMTFAFHLIDHDEKIANYMMTMKHGTEGWTAATCEQILLCVDLRVRRGRPWPEDILRRLRAVKEAHARRPRPPEAGRPIGIRRKA